MKNSNIRSLGLIGLLIIVTFNYALALDPKCYQTAKKLIESASIAKSNSISQRKPLSSYAELVQQYNQLASRCEINFDYHEYGCNVRAYWMGYLLAMQGISGGLIWIDLKNAHSSDWEFHVAAYVDLKNSNNTISRWVIDPQLASSPLEIHDWKKLFAKMNVKGSLPTHLTNYYQKEPPFNLYYMDPMAPRSYNFEKTSLLQALEFFRTINW